MNHFRRAVLLALLLALAAFAVGDVAQTQDARALGDVMPEVYAARTGTAHYTVRTIVAIEAIPILADGWAGYEHGGFDWPADYTRVSDVYLQTVPGDWLSGMLEVRGRKDDPGVLLVLVYMDADDLEWSGNPPGTHPTGGAWVVDAETWLEAVESRE